MDVGRLSNGAINDVFSIVEKCLKVHTLSGFSQDILDRTHFLLGQEMTACGTVKVANKKVLSTLNRGYPPDFLSAIVDTDGCCQSPLFDGWIQTQVPQVFESRASNSLTADEAGLYRRFELSTVLSSGLLDMEGRYASYFGFAQLQDGVGSYQLNLSDLLIPHLHVAYSRIIHRHGDSTAKPDHRTLIATSPKPNRSNGDSERFKKRSNPLSAREHEVLQWLFGGKSNWDIGMILSISEFTVKNHVQSILRKLNANGRQHAVAKALEAGLIQL